MDGNTINDGHAALSVDRVHNWDCKSDRRQWDDQDKACESEVDGSVLYKA